MPGSGKTTVVRLAGRGRRFAFIANNEGSASSLEGVAAVTDFYPLKSPCARIRQFLYRADMHLNDDVPVIVSEPPGNCMETSAPMLNPIFASRKGDYTVGALITVIDGSRLTVPISRRSTDGLRLHNMVFESDCVCVTRSDQLDEDVRSSISDAIKGINDTCSIVFFSESGEGISEMSEKIFGDSVYSRPLFC